MPKISKIRFVNFTYNENRHIYDQTLDFYNGEDTLLNLQNGGGKTVLVQMMMQPIIPKQKLKDRFFKSYFMNAKAPAYLMIEWLLDDRSTRVLTGIGIKRIQGKNIEDEANLKIVTFISEYEEGSNYDIKNIELTNEEKSIVKLIEFDRVVKNLSEAEKEGNDVWVFRWNTTDDKREYERRLAGYKINPSEWKNLMVKINESEAGLNSFFNDCKTNKALIKKWFIPTIEEQLNKTGDLVENIRELIKNHSGQLVKNEDMLAEREIFEDFRRKSALFLTDMKEYGDLLSRFEKNEWDLGNAYVQIENRLRNLTLEKEEITCHIEQAKNSVKELTYQSLSREYYIIEDDLLKLHEKDSHILEEIEGLKAELEEQQDRENLLLCVKLRDELINLNARIAKFESELEKETLQQEDVKHIVGDIKYALKVKYKDRILRLESVLDDEKTQLSDMKTQLSEYQNTFAKANQEITSLGEQLIRIRGRISAFDESEVSLRVLYPDFKPVKNMDTGEYGDDILDALRTGLHQEETDIRQSLLGIREKRLENENKRLRLEKECQELRSEFPTLAIEKSKKESAYQSFQEEKQGVTKILRSYQLREEWLFDKEKSLISLHADKEKYQKLMDDLNLENSINRKRLKQYESGKTFELSDELKQIFEDKNIFVEFGHDWLRNLSEHKKAKLRMVRNNPFLPYALIVSRKDFEIIKSTEFDRILSPVIPIIEREKLEKVFAIKRENQIYAMEDMNFLIPFDDRVLNKNYLKEICDEISLKIDKNTTVMERAQESYQHITADIFKIENFSFTGQDVVKLQEDIKTVTEKWEEYALTITACDEEILSLKKMDTHGLSLQSSFENQENKFSRKKEDILGFIKKCGQYSQDAKEKNQKEETRAKMSASLKEAEDDITRTKNNLEEKNLRISNILSTLEKDKQQYRKYEDAIQSDTDQNNTVWGNAIQNNTAQSKWMKEEIETLEAKLAVYNSEISGKIQSLQEILEDYRRQRDEKQETMVSYGIPEYRYIGKEYRAFEYEEIRVESGIIHGKLEEFTADKNKVQFKIAKRTSDLDYRKKNIEERCDFLEPLSREWIKDLDFEKEKTLQEAILRDLEKKMQQAKKQENSLLRIRFGLEEYRDFADQITEPQNIEGDLGEYVLQRMKEYKECTVLANDSKNTIASAYFELENEFMPKAEMFKNLFRSILNGERKYQPSHAINAFNRIFLQMDRKLEQHSIDMKKIDDMEKYIIDNTLSYLKNVYDEMDHIDRNSTIEFDGKRCKMLMIGLPEKDTLESVSLKEYLKHTIANCADLYKQGKPLDALLSSEIDTYNLFDRFVSINKIEITLMKIEPNKLKKKSWRQVIVENSGGELFVSAFVVFISLLTYMRGDNMLSAGMDGKVLIMDNPFGPITSEHLLKPLFEISKKYNTQMICLTDVKGHAIYDRFNLIYSLNIEREVGREDEYIELKTIKKDIHTEEDEVLSASMFKIEDKSRFERA